MSEQNVGSGHLNRTLGWPALFAAAYGNVGSDIYFALGLVALYALGLTPVVFMLAGLLFITTALSYAEAATLLPEAGGCSSFARVAFNDLLGFLAGWAVTLDYILTAAISALFVPHYLAALGLPWLRHPPGDAIGGIVVLAFLVAVNLVGVRDSARVNITVATADIITQGIIIIIGLVAVFSLPVLLHNIRPGIAPTWGQFVFSISIAAVAYTGIETISNLAGETKDPRRAIPRATILLIVTVLLIYALLTSVALSAMPVHFVGHPNPITASRYETELGTTFQADPIVGIVDNLPPALHGVVRPLRAWVGLLAATILIIATNAALLGVSRLTYSQAGHRHLPSFLGKLHPKTNVPWIAIIMGGVIAAVLLLPGLFGVAEAELLGILLSFGALIGFTAAHFAVVRLRWLGVESPGTFRIPGALHIRGKELAILPLVGGIGTAAVWVTVVLTHPAARLVGSGWMLAGLVFYLAYRRYHGYPITGRITAAAFAKEQIAEVEADEK